jgi:hypothetical protein
MTIRAIIHTNPKFGFWILSGLFAIAIAFQLANFYSWGLNPSFLAIFIPILLLSPILGAIWLSIDAWILRTIGWFLGGRASQWNVRSALAWSKLPYIISSIMWVVLTTSYQDTAFIQLATGASAVFIDLIFLIVFLWSMTLLTQAICEVQSFSLPKALLNVVLNLLISFSLIVLSAFIARYLYIM